MPIGIVGGTLIAGAITGGTALTGSYLNARAAKKAGSIQEQAADAALAWEKEQEARRQKEYEEERARDWMLQDEARGYAAEDREISAEDRARRIRLSQPYTDLGGASARGLHGLLSMGGGGGSMQLGPQPVVPTSVPKPYHLPPPALRAGTPPPGTPGWSGPGLDEVTLSELARRRA